jgi:hypothetical protein
MSIHSFQYFSHVLQSSNSWITTCALGHVERAIMTESRVLAEAAYFAMVALRIVDLSLLQKFK